MLKVYVRPIAVSLLACILPACVVFFMDSSMLRLLITVLSSLMCSATCVYYLGIDEGMRIKVNCYLKEKLSFLRAEQ